MLRDMIKGTCACDVTTSAFFLSLLNIHSWAKKLTFSYELSRRHLNCTFSYELSRRHLNSFPMFMSTCTTNHHYRCTITVTVQTILLMSDPVKFVLFPCINTNKISVKTAFVCKQRTEIRFQNSMFLNTWQRTEIWEACKERNRVEPGYNDIGLYDTSSITSDILWYQLLPHC
jgi:hypothetical protein